MPYCSECGVELDPEVSACPLCGIEICKSHAAPTGSQDYAESNEIEDMLAHRPPGYERKLAMQILSVVFVTPILVSLVVDWLLSGQATWSLYVGVSLAALWVYSVFPLLFYRHLWLILGASIFMTGFLMWAVDVLDPRARWFWGIGMPILAVLVLIVAMVTGFSLLSRRRGANIAAFVLLGIIGFCTAIDVITKIYVESSDPLLTWSLIIVAALLPVAGFLLYFHYALSKKINLRKKLYL
ncbi:hypothetical protein [Spirochaeta dissipatitropha]